MKTVTRNELYYAIHCYETRDNGLTSKLFTDYAVVKLVFTFTERYVIVKDKAGKLYRAELGKNGWTLAKWENDYSEVELEPVEGRVGIWDKIKNILRG